jgi:hypothetical protein
MSLKLAKSPIWVTALIVGLVAATALVAGYVDRPGTGSEVTAADGTCADCPKAGTSACCQAKGGGCADGGCSGGVCATEAAGAASGSVMAATEDAPATGATLSGCQAGGQTAGGGCGGGQCAAGN